jgi:hypothetical protein
MKVLSTMMKRLYVRSVPYSYLERPLQDGESWPKGKKTKVKSIKNSYDSPSTIRERQANPWRDDYE